MGAERGIHRGVAALRQSLTGSPRCAVVSWTRSRGAVGQPMAGQNLAHRSTVELIVSRQVPDCVTGQISSHQRCLVLCVEMSLPLPRDG